MGRYSGLPDLLASLQCSITIVALVTARRAAYSRTTCPLLAGDKVRKISKLGVAR